MYLTRVLFFLITFLLLTIIIDVYFYFGLKSYFKSFKNRKWLKRIYWFISFSVIAFYVLGIVLWFFKTPLTGKFRIIFQGISFCFMVPKFIAIIFFMLDDIIRFFKWLKDKIFGTPKFSSSDSAKSYSRLKFLQVTGLSFFGLFTGIFSYGIFKGAYNINVLYKKLRIPNLPKGFEGLKIIQISDLHVGSFMSADPVKRMVELINKENPDMVFFTGDLVNDIAEEALPYVDELKKLKAKFGVFSILGNHDYGDYYYDKNAPDFVQNKKHNKDLIQKIYQDCGWRLLLDENVIFESEGAKMAVIGIENWAGRGTFARYGDLHKAVKGTEDVNFKLLLSHDPSHWDVQVKPEFKDIDVMFSGHTHGMQFGIEIPGFKWSPSKWVYPQWAGLYKDGKQQLYVNRGIGFVGYPGRVGIYPEISVFELKPTKVYNPNF